MYTTPQTRIHAHAHAHAHTHTHTHTHTTQSHFPCGTRYVSYRVAFGFQMPQLDWPGAIPRYIGPNQLKNKPINTQ